MQKPALRVSRTIVREAAEDGEDQVKDNLDNVMALFLPKSRRGSMNDDTKDDNKEVERILQMEPNERSQRDIRIVKRSWRNNKFI